MQDGWCILTKQEGQGFCGDHVGSDDCETASQGKYFHVATGRRAHESGRNHQVHTSYSQHVECKKQIRHCLPTQPIHSAAIVLSHVSLADVQALLVAAAGWQSERSTDSVSEIPNDRDNNHARTAPNVSVQHQTLVGGLYRESNRIECPCLFIGARAEAQE